MAKTESVRPLSATEREILQEQTERIAALKRQLQEEQAVLSKFCALVLDGTGGFVNTQTWSIDKKVEDGADAE